MGNFEFIFFTLVPMMLVFIVGIDLGIALTIDYYERRKRKEVRK